MVQGSVIRAHLDRIVDHASRDEVIEFFEILPPHVRRQVSLMRPTSWYDPSVLIEIDSAIDTFFGDAWR